MPGHACVDFWGRRIICLGPSKVLVLTERKNLQQLLRSLQKNVYNILAGDKPQKRWKIKKIFPAAARESFSDSKNMNNYRVERYAGALSLHIISHFHLGQAKFAKP